jgi:hypothetical protein
MRSIIQRPYVLVLVDHLDFALIFMLRRYRAPTGMSRHDSSALLYCTFFYLLAFRYTTSLSCCSRSRYNTMSAFLMAFTVVRGILISTLFIAHLIVADVLLSLLLPFSWAAPSACYDICSRLAGSVWTHIQLIFTRVNHAAICLSKTSSQVHGHESAIIVSNHISWTDFYMIQELAIRSSMLGRCRWFAKSQLRFVVAVEPSSTVS